MQGQARPDLLRAGYFGSYARGDWGVGSDLDVILIVLDSKTTFMERSTEWDLAQFPVLVDIVVYTLDEWSKLAETQSRFFKTIEKEVIWVYKRDVGQGLHSESE
jgi:predicted nucleotidyltransferase